MKKSETEESIEFISELRSHLRHLFPMELPFDSTGGRPELQPLRGRPALKWLVVCAGFSLSGLLILLVHFNIGFMLSIPLTIAILWAFATLRDLPPAPMKVDIRFWSDGSLRIQSDWASVYLNDVGPIWAQDGLVFALAHDYEKRLASGDSHYAAILPVLRGRAARLGVESWNPADLHDPRKEMIPGEWEEREKMDHAIRSLYGPLLEQSLGTAKPVPIMLGKLTDGEDAESSSQDRRALVAISFMAFMHLYEEWTLQKPEGPETTAA